MQFMRFKWLLAVGVVAAVIFGFSFYVQGMEAGKEGLANDDGYGRFSGKSTEELSEEIGGIEAEKSDIEKNINGEHISLENNPPVRSLESQNQNVDKPRVVSEVEEVEMVSEKKNVIEDTLSYLILVNRQSNLLADFVPPDLVNPAVQFTTQEDSPKKLMRKVAARALELLFEKAKEDHISILGVSGYRSYQRQEEIFSYKVNQIGLERARLISAYPGQSEHQTGLAMDVTGPGCGYALEESFGETTEGKWLAQNAPDFGFIIRYPHGKELITGYSYEPWHLRYVGVEAAREIANRGITLEEYLGKVP